MEEKKYTKAELSSVLRIVAEAIGGRMSEDVADFIITQLRAMASGAVIMAAIERCSHECKGTLALVDVKNRIEGLDGRPDADEAWAIALDSEDEAKTIVWTNEICEAKKVAQPILDSGDKIAARMAFKSAYARMVEDSRRGGVKPVWWPSLGTDKDMRELALSEAARTGRIGAERAEFFLPPPCTPDSPAFLLTNGAGVRLLTVDGKSADEIDPAHTKPLDDDQKRKNLERLAEIKAMFQVKPVVDAAYTPEDDSQ